MLFERLSGYYAAGGRYPFTNPKNAFGQGKLNSASKESLKIKSEQLKY
jgi:hypothetical protein